MTSIFKRVWSGYQNITSVAVPRIAKMPPGKIALTIIRKLKMVFFYPIHPVALTNPLQVNGLTLYWNPQSYWYAMTYSTGKYEEDTIRLLLSLLKPGATMVDLGANIGYFSLVAAKKIGETGKIYSFEPDPLNYSLFLKNISTNNFCSIIIPENMAVQEKPGRVFFHLGKSSSGVGSLYKSDATGSHKIVVEATSLDGFFRQRRELARSKHYKD